MFPSFRFVSSSGRGLLHTIAAFVLISSLITTSLALPAIGTSFDLTSLESGVGFNTADIVLSLINSHPLVWLATAVSARLKRRQALYFDHIEIKPGNLQVLQGDRVDLLATAWNGHQPVNGVAFEWSITEVGDGKPETNRSEENAHV